MFRDLVNYLRETCGKRKNAYIPPVKYDLKRPKLDVTIPTKGSRAWSGLVLHHSASADTVKRNVDSIIKYHTSWRVDAVTVSKEEWDDRKKKGLGKKFDPPWSDVGYHFLIEMVGSEAVFHFGRSLSKVGAHAGHPKSNSFNENYIGLCVLGNYDIAAPSPEIFQYTLMAVRKLMSIFHFTCDRVIGHREVYMELGVPIEKMCPGQFWSMERFRQEL